MISFEDVLNLHLKVGKILTAEALEGSEKLVKLSVDLGIKKQEEKVVVEAKSESSETVIAEAATAETVAIERDIRTIIAGIKKFYAPEDLVGKEVVVVANLAPRKMMGLESQGMILAASSGESLALIAPEKAIEPGAEVH